MLRGLIGFCCAVSLVCGAGIIALGIWNGVAITWGSFAIGILIWGGVVAGLSLLGMVAACGIDCGKILMFLYSLSMLLLGLAQAIFVIIAGIKKAPWVTSLAEKYAPDGDQEAIDWAEEQYTKYWWAFIALLATTAGSSLLGSCFGFWYFMEDTALKRAKRDAERAEGQSASKPRRRWTQFMVSDSQKEARKALSETISEGQRLQNERKAVLDEIKSKYSTTQV